MKDLIWPFRHAEDIGYIIWPMSAAGAIGLAVLLIILSLAWPEA